jgi:hypothetical protein
MGHVAKQLNLGVTLLLCKYQGTNLSLSTSSLLTSKKIGTLQKVISRWKSSQGNNLNTTQVESFF